MHKGEAPTVFRLVALGLLVAAWIVIWLDLADAEANPRPGGDIPFEALVGGFAMCAWAGGLARFAGAHGRRRWAGPVAGAAMVVTYIAGAVAIQLMQGTFGQLGEGETPFSTLIELPFWLGVPLALGAVLGSAGWLVASAVAAVADARRSAHRP